MLLIQLELKNLVNYSHWILDDNIGLSEHKIQEIKEGTVNINVKSLTGYKPEKDETGEIKKLSYDRNNKTFTYGDYSTKLVGQSVFGNIKMNTTTVYDTLLTDNSILLIDIPVYNPEFEGEDFGFHLVYQYNPKKTSVDNNYPFGGELSGHLYFRDKFIGTDDGIYAGLRFV